MKFIHVDQGTDEWKRLRLGMPTASNFHHIITPKGALVDSRERKQYKYRLIAERILRQPVPPKFQGDENTERGIEMEPRAVSALEAKMGLTLQPGGFVVADGDRYGCSPDRLSQSPLLGQRSKALRGLASLIPPVGKWEAVEVKCPLAWNHIGHMIDGPGDRYKPQVQGQILVGKFRAVHFWSYHPGFAPVHIVTLPDEVFIRKLANLLDLFCDELDAGEAFVRRHGNVEEIVKEAAIDVT